VLEIAKASLVLDRAKAPIYARAGVPIYLLLDLTASKLEVRERPTASGEFEVVRVLGVRDTLELPDVRPIFVSELF
jgi:Putative restriction endonuclease